MMFVEVKFLFLCVYTEGDAIIKYRQECNIELANYFIF